MSSNSNEIVATSLDAGWQLSITPRYEIQNSDTPRYEIQNSDTPIVLDAVAGILSTEEYRRFLFTVPSFYLVLTPLGIATNIANIYGFVKLGITDSVSITMLFLSLSDLFLSAVLFITGLGTLMLALEEATAVLFFPVDPFILTFYCGTLGINGCTATTLITTYLALTRCFCVAKPLRFKSMFTVRRTLPILILFLLFGHLSYIAAYIGTGTVEKFDPEHNVSREVMWVSEQRRVRQSVAIFIMNLLIPFSCQIIVSVSVIYLIAGLKSASAFRSSVNVAVEYNKPTPAPKPRVFTKSNHADSQKNMDVLKPSKGISEKSAKSRKDTELHGKELRVARQVILISVVFIITNIPAIIRTSGKLIEEEFAVGKRYHNIYQIASHAIVLSSMCNASTTLLIYWKFNTAFRNVFSRQKAT